MALIKIESYIQRAPMDVKTMMSAVCQAVIDALHIPEPECLLSYVQIEQDQYILPSRQTEQFLLVQVVMKFGRNERVKQNLFQAIGYQLHQLGYQVEDLFIVINEQPEQNWCIRGDTIDVTRIDL